MAKDPAFLFYPNDYLGGTMGYTHVLHGAYILCLIYQFQNGHFTEDQILPIAGESWNIIRCKFTKDECGCFYNQRLDSEINKRAEYSRSRSENQKKRWEKRNICNTHVIHMGNGNGNGNRDIKTSEDKKTNPSVPSVVWGQYSPEYRLSVYLWKRIQENGTTQKEPDYQKWSDGFDKIHRIDKHPYGWIQEIIRNVMDDNFWKQNIRSPEKLRQKINEGKLDRFIPDEFETDQEVLDRLKQKEREGEGK
jgi:uncharacterized protein YdaU (DUF1376 family)